MNVEVCGTSESSTCGVQKKRAEVYTSTTHDINDLFSPKGMEKSN